MIVSHGSGLTSFPKDDPLAGAGAAIAAVLGVAAGAHSRVESHGRSGTPTKSPARRVGGHRDDPGGEGNPGIRRSSRGGACRPDGTAGGPELRSGDRKEHQYA